MGKQVQAWQVLVAVVLLCAGSVWAVRNWRHSSRDVGRMVTRFPKTVHTMMFVDAGALSAGGFLPRLSSQDVDSEYVRFVEESAFDYQRDLQSVLMGFDDQASYVLAGGHFDWKALQAYAASRNGSCRFTICRITGFANGRSVGWGPLRGDVLALSAGPDPWAVLQLLDSERESASVPPPSGPAWVTTTGRALKNSGRLPEGLRTYAALLEAADRVTLAVRPDVGKGELGLDLTADCPQPDVARTTVEGLQHLTAALNGMIAKEKMEPNAADFSGVLAGGKFQAEGNRVTGHWPLPKRLLERFAAVATP